MIEIIRRTVVRMPNRQRQVASVVIDSFPEIPSTEKIRDVIFSTTGELLTIVAIKRAWQEAQIKIREQLTNAGYVAE
jgi:hypothetical protein